MRTIRSELGDADVDLVAGGAWRCALLAVAFGHTHVPWKREIDGILFVNAGSVGRPKDGDPRASWAIAMWDGRRIDVEQVRTEYDVERAAAAIRDSDLPHAFADDLRRGGPQPRE